MEYLLKLSNDFEALKKKTLDGEQYENFEIMGKRNLEDQIKEYQKVKMNSRH